MNKPEPFARWTRAAALAQLERPGSRAKEAMSNPAAETFLSFARRPRNPADPLVLAQCTEAGPAQGGRNPTVTQRGWAGDWRRSSGIGRRLRAACSVPVVTHSDTRSSVLTLAQENNFVVTYLYEDAL